MPGAPRPIADRWPLWATIAIAALSALAVAFTPMGAHAAVALVALSAMGLSSVGRPMRLAWWWGFLLPVDLIKNVPNELMDVARYGGLVWLCLQLAPDISSSRRAEVIRMSAICAAVGAIRLVGSTARLDRFGMFIAAVMVVGALTAPFVAVRVRSHLAVLSGFAGGMALSSAVSVMQAMDVPTLVDGNQAGSRFPGLSASTSLFSWLLSLGIIVAVYLAVTRRHGRFHQATGWVALPLTVAALVVNGAQGGLLGLACAALAVGAFSWRHIPRQVLVRSLAGGIAALALLVGLVMALGIETPTLDGAFGSGGYRNEKLRLEVAQTGWNEMIAHPFTGVGRTNFSDRNDIAPHFLPLEAGVTSGIIGFLVAGYLLWTLLWVVLRGPVGQTAVSRLGLALCAAMFANTLSEMGGPFTGLPRFALTLIAVVACRGELWPGQEAAPPGDGDGEDATLDAAGAR